jgi:hypothetical protein
LLVCYSNFIYSSLTMYWIGNVNIATLKLYSLFTPKSTAILRTKGTEARTPIPAFPLQERRGEFTHASERMIFGGGQGLRMWGNPTCSWVMLS